MNDSRKSNEITDPAELVKGKRYGGMWFSVCEAEDGGLVALVSPSGKLLRGSEAMARYACIGTDGEWPKPTSILIEWDGGFTTAKTEGEVEAIIVRKLLEWEAAGDAGERGDFLVRPNTSETA